MYKQQIDRLLAFAVLTFVACMVLFIIGMLIIANDLHRVNVQSEVVDLRMEGVRAMVERHKDQAKRLERVDSVVKLGSDEWDAQFDELVMMAARQSPYMLVITQWWPTLKAYPVRVPTNGIELRNMRIEPMKVATNRVIELRSYDDAINFGPYSRGVR